MAPRAQNSAKTAKPAKAAPGRPFEKGRSGNPGGRPKGLGVAIRAKYGEDGAQLIEALHAIAFAKRVIKKGRVISPGVPPKERLAALKELLDRGWGKSTQPVDVDASDDLAALLARIEPK